MGIKFANNAATTLASAITNAATSITVATGKGVLFPAITSPDYFYATLSNSAGTTIEIVKVTARSADTLTVARGQEGTTASAFAVGDKFELRVTAKGLSDLATDALTPYLRGDGTDASVSDNPNWAIGKRTNLWPTSRNGNYIQTKNSLALDLNPLGNEVRIAGYPALHSGNAANYVALPDGSNTYGSWPIQAAQAYDLIHSGYNQVPYNDQYGTFSWAQAQYPGEVLSVKDDGTIGFAQPKVSAQYAEYYDNFEIGKVNAGHLVGIPTLVGVTYAQYPNQLGAGESIKMLNLTDGFMFRNHPFVWSGGTSADAEVQGFPIVLKTMGVGEIVSNGSVMALTGDFRKAQVGRDWSYSTYINGLYGYSTTYVYDLVSEPTEYGIKFVVATGSNGRISYYSPNTGMWYGDTSYYSTFGSGKNVLCGTYSGSSGAWVYGGDSGCLASSYSQPVPVSDIRNASSTTATKFSTVFGTNAVRSMTWLESDSTTYIVGDSGKTAKTTDLTTFVSIPQLTTIMGTTSITYVKAIPELDLVFAFGNNKAAKGKGLTWTDIYPALGANVKAITYGNGKLIAVGDYVILVSVNSGTTWTVIPAPYGAELRDVKWTGERFFAIAKWGVLLISSDGYTWEANPYMFGGMDMNKSTHLWSYDGNNNTRKEFMAVNYGADSSVYKSI